MEGQSKGMNGLGQEVRVANKRGVGIGTSESLLRLLAMGLTLSSAVILGVDKQTKVVPIKLLDSLPPMNVPVTAKWHYLSAFVYLVVTNAIGSVYAAISLIVSLKNCNGKSDGTILLLLILDVAAMGLLFSSNGAATAIGLMGLKGNSHVQWNKVCDVFDKYCHQGAAALAASFLGAVVFLLLVILAAKRLHRDK